MVNLLRIMIIGIFFLSCQPDPIEDVVIEQDDEEATDAPADTSDTDGNEDSEDNGEDEDEQDDAESDPQLEMYFPGSDQWQTLDALTLKWNSDSINLLSDFLESKNTHAFIVLYKGRIVLEQYFHGWSEDTSQPIASAGKTVTAALIGILEQRGLLSLNDATNKHLGQGWSSLPPEKENLIKIKHHLSMTTGLDEREDPCNDPGCMKYVADAGKRWAYHNPSYNILNDVLEAATGNDLATLTKEYLGDPLGWSGWQWENNILSMKARDMAKFGLLMLNKGVWNGSKILDNVDYFNKMTSSSSNLNKAYGYLWWLNGASSFMIPESAETFGGTLVTTAPDDMFAAMGKGDKKIYVVPSLDLVVVRHGDESGERTFGPSSFDTELWRRLQGIIGY